jgi:Xaa-Pro aminopeptidase
VNDRVERLRARLEEPLLVTNPTNVRYLTGFQSSNAVVLVEPTRVRLFADFRYASGGRAVEGVEFEETRRDVLGDLAQLLTGRVGFESAHVSYAGYEKLRSRGLELVPRPGAVEALRAIKDEGELAILRRACEITDRVYDRLAEEKFVGETERDVTWRMTELFHEEGQVDAAFELIVASGPNSARPHARAGDRTIERGETVVIDAGCTIDGYASDYTRTFVTGSLPDELREAYRVVLEAQQAALDGIHAGITGVEADALARRVIDATGFKGTFGHGLGHGLGLEVHEGPRLSTESSDTLEPGNVVTVEPGIYLEGRGGIRIEDDVVVTASGIENLTKLRKDLVDVG